MELPNHRIRVSWLTSTRFLQRRWSVLRAIGFYQHYEFLVPSTRMRVGNVSRWVNENTSDIECELFDPSVGYDVIIVVKNLDDLIWNAVWERKQAGTRVIYDANVNYWQVWGDYGTSSPKPSPEIQRQATRIAGDADCIVADSSYISSVVRELNRRVEVVTDNVDINVYSHVRIHRSVPCLNLIWSGMSHKADHLTLIYPALKALGNHLQLTLVSEKCPPVMKELAAILPTRFVPFTDRRYAELLGQSDVIISPKRLLNGYDYGHTEYKITLGMAAGLPVIASPQPSYVEAIQLDNCGYIAQTEEDWHTALEELLVNVELRKAMGASARTTVLKKYSTPVVADKYAAVIRALVNS